MTSLVRVQTVNERPLKAFTATGNGARAYKQQKREFREEEGLGKVDKR